MKITLLENNEKIRRTFIDRFVMSWKEFQVEHKEFIDKMLEKNQIVDIEFYNRSYLWDKISSKYSRVSFREALDFLSNIDGDAIFMSEDEKVPCSAELFIDGNKIRSFAAKSNAKELAKLIEKEWFETYILEEQGRYNPNPILPEDLYVFDSSMSWFVVFTHETTDWETEDSMKEAESRYCILYFKK